MDSEIKNEEQVKNEDEIKKNTDAKTIHLKKSEGTASLYEWVHSLVFAVAVVVILLTFFVRLEANFTE